MSLISALRIATGGMQYNQTGLGTISHNVVNANTPGYTRQSVQSSSVSYNGMGAGVQLGEIQRVVDTFLQARSLNSESDLSYASTLRNYMNSIEGAFSNASSNGSIEDLIHNTFDAFSELSNSPANSALRRNAMQTASLLADTIRSINADVDTVQSRVDGQISAELSTINVILKRIHDLNAEIATQRATSVGAANTSDLEDARDIQVQELSKRFGIQVSTTESGAYRIVTENGRKLVDEASYVQLKRAPGSGDFGDIVVQNVKVDGTLDTTEIELLTSNMKTGNIKALVDIRDITVPNLLAELDSFVDTFKTQFNLIHSRGTTIPPQNTLTSGNIGDLTATTDDLFTNLSADLAGTTFNASVVDAQGNVIATTLGNGGPVSIPGVGPFSLEDLADLINNNADIGNTTLGGALGITATATTNSNGEPVIQIQTQTPGQYIVLDNAGGDTLGLLGMNNFFTGQSSDDFAVVDAIQNDPELIAVGRMRGDDGGLSSLNNENAIAMAQMADTRLSFAAAGTLGPQTVTSAAYLGQITSNLAIAINDAGNRESFTESLNNQISEMKGSVSGVNVNEELSLMLVYQNGFQASARLITVISDLFNTLMGTIR